MQVASLGDSITAGTGAGAQHLVEVLHEYRGATYLTGADPGTASLHNFIKQYNPALLGGSRGSTKAHMCLELIVNQGYQHCPAGVGSVQPAGRAQPQVSPTT